MLYLLLLSRVSESLVILEKGYPDKEQLLFFLLHHSASAAERDRGEGNMCILDLILLGIMMMMQPV